MASIAQVERRYFDADEYHRMVEAGILSEDDRVELIQGEILRMAPIGLRHAACVDRLTALFGGYVSETATVRVQSPVHLDDHSEPQPDAALLRPRRDFYASGHPGPADIFLIVEVADTSLEYDRTYKLPLYARAGIVEVWLVDLSNSVIETYTQPVDVQYQAKRQVAGAEALAPQSFPDLQLSADSILG